ncbi:hypothetical protein RRG08_034922 [Elysia crispata]|uniref:Uncharacterized protein n=1 Tax=Elysia crispata TaxID=231223 RepID=A0AAE1D314_9GAST|nr:hypothetical protein RRG08_034922 [Elysia crispata]
MSLQQFQWHLIKPRSNSQVCPYYPGRSSLTDQSHSCQLSAADHHFLDVIDGQAYNLTVWPFEMWPKTGCCKSRGISLGLNAWRLSTIRVIYYRPLYRSLLALGAPGRFREMFNEMRETQKGLGRDGKGGGEMRPEG